MLLKSSTYLYSLVRSFVFGAGISCTIAGCGGDALPPSERSLDEPQPVALIRGSVVNGKLSLRTDDAQGTDPRSSAPQGFSEFGSGSVSFDTPSDGLGTGSCTASQYCAQVDATNLSGRLMDTMFVEITDYTYVPPGMTVAWAGTPFTASDAYANFFVNSGAIEAASYGDFTIGQTKSVEWKFDIASAGPPSADFYFDAAVYASFRRSTRLSGKLQAKGQPAVDACAATGGIPTYLNGADDAETVFELPFPFTLRDITYDRAVVGSNGYLLFYRTGSTPPTLGASSGTNLALTQATVPAGFYLFWDDLAFDAGSGICVSIAGAKPNRTLTLTWGNAKVSTSNTGKIWAPQRLTYSLVLEERIDAATFAYNLPTGGATPTTRGQGATTGVRFVLNGSLDADAISRDVTSPWIPSATADYTSRLRLTQSPVNP